MLTVEQAVNLYHLLCQVVLLDVPGEVVELGCYEGTTAILLQTTLDRLGQPEGAPRLRLVRGIAREDRRGR